MAKLAVEKGEDKDKYVGRCMADDKMKADYPSDEQRMAVCKKSFREQSALNAAKDDGHELIAEIFAAGKWNGLSFSLDDLEEIAETFHILGDMHRVPVKLGHNSKQPLVDGQMALGWVDDVFVEDQKLKAHIVGMPSVVYNAIKQQRFKNVSIELDIDVSHKGESYQYVLSAVALLGADIPAVNTLADLQHYLYNRETLQCSRRATFTAISGLTEDDDMATLEEVQAQLKKMEADLEAEREASKKFKRESEEKDQLLATEKAEAAKKEFAAKRDDATKRLDALVAAKRITPATREKYTGQIKEDDQAAMEKVLFAVEALEEAGGQVKMSTESTAGKGAGAEAEKDEERDADEVIAERAYKMSREDKIPYRDACFAVLQQDPKLAERYRDTGTEHLKH